jgi:hypothetical protein
VVDPAALDPAVPEPVVDPAALDPAVPEPVVDPAELEPAAVEPAVPEPAVEPQVVNETDANTNFLKDNILRTIAESGDIKYSDLVRGGSVGEFFDWVPRTLTQIKEAIRTGKIARSESAKLADAMAELVAEKKVLVKPGTADTYVKGENFDYVIPKKSLMSNEVKSVPDTAFSFGDEFKVAERDENLPPSMRGRVEANRYYRQTAGEEIRNTAEVEPKDLQRIRNTHAPRGNVAGSKESTARVGLINGNQFVNDENGNPLIHDSPAYASDNKEDLIKNLVVHWGQTPEQAEALGDFVDMWATSWAVNVAKLEGININKRLRALRTADEQLKPGEVADLRDFEQWKRGIKEVVLFNNIKSNRQLIVDLRDIFYKKHVPALAILSEFVPEMAGTQGLQTTYHTKFDPSVSDFVQQTVIFSRGRTDSNVRAKDYYTQVHEFIHALHRTLPEAMYHDLASRYINALSIDHLFGTIGEITNDTWSKNAGTNQGEKPFVPMWIEERITETLTKALADSIIKIGSVEKGFLKFDADGKPYEINDYDPTVSDLAIRISNAMGDARVGTNAGIWNINHYEKPLLESMFDKVNSRGPSFHPFTAGTTLVLTDGTGAVNKFEFVRIQQINRNNNGKLVSVVFMPIEVPNGGKNLLGEENWIKTQTDKHPKISDDGKAFTVNVSNFSKFKIDGVGGSNTTMPSEVIDFYQKWFGHHTRYVHNEIAGMQPSNPVVRLQGLISYHATAGVQQRAVGYRWFGNAEEALTTYGQRVHEAWTGVMSKGRLVERMKHSFLGWLDRGGYTSFIQETASGNEPAVLFQGTQSQRVRTLSADIKKIRETMKQWDADLASRIETYRLYQENKTNPPTSDTKVAIESTSEPQSTNPIVKSDELSKPPVLDPDESHDFFADTERAVPGIDYPEELDEYKPPVDKIPLESSLTIKGDREVKLVNDNYGELPDRHFLGGETVWKDVSDSGKFGIAAILDGFTKLRSRLVYPLTNPTGGMRRGVDSDFGWYVKPGITEADIDAAVEQWKTIITKEQYADDVYARQWNGLSPIEQQQVVAKLKVHMLDTVALRSAQQTRIDAIVYDDGLNPIDRVNRWAVEEFWKSLGPDYRDIDSKIYEFRERFKSNPVIAQAIEEQIALAKPQRDQYQAAYESRLKQQKEWETQRQEREATEAFQREQDARAEADAYESFAEANGIPSAQQRQAWQQHQDAVDKTLRNVILEYMKNPLKAVRNPELGLGILANSVYGSYINRYVLGAYRMRLPMEDQAGFVYPSVTTGTAKGVLREAGTDYEFRARVAGLDNAITKAEKLWWDTNGEIYELAKATGDRALYKLYQEVVVDDGEGNKTTVKGKTELENWSERRRKVIAQIKETNRKQKLGVRAQRGRDLDPRSIFVQQVQEDVYSSVQNILVNTKQIKYQREDGLLGVGYVVRTLSGGEVVESSMMSMRQYQSYLFRAMRNAAKTSTAKFFEDESYTGTQASDWMSRFKRVKDVDLDADTVTYENEIDEQIRRFSIYNLAKSMSRRSGALTQNNLGMDKMIRKALDQSDKVGNNKYSNIQDGVFKPIEFNGKTYNTRQGLLDAIDSVRLGYQYDVSLTEVAKEALLRKANGESDEYGLTSLSESELNTLIEYSTAVDNNKENALLAFRQFIRDTPATRNVPGLLLRPTGLSQVTAYAPYARITGDKQRLMMFGVTTVDVELEVEKNKDRYAVEQDKKNVTNRAALFILGQEGETIDVEVASEIDVAKQIGESADIDQRYYSATYRMFNSALRYIGRNAEGISKVLIDKQRARPLFVNPESNDGIQISFDQMDLRLSELKQNKLSMESALSTMIESENQVEYKRIQDSIKSTSDLITQYEEKIDKFHTLANKSSVDGQLYVDRLIEIFGGNSIAPDVVIGGKQAANIIAGLKSSASRTGFLEYMKSVKESEQTSVISDYVSLKDMLDAWGNYDGLTEFNVEQKAQWKTYIESLKFKSTEGRELANILTDISKVKATLKRVNNYVTAFEYVRNTYLSVEQQLDSPGDTGVTKIYVDATSSSTSPNTALYFEMKRLHMLLNGFSEMPNVDRAFRLKTMSGTESRVAAQKSAINIQNAAEKSAYQKIYDALRWERGNINYTDVRDSMKSVINRIDMLEEIFNKKTLQGKSFKVDDVVDHGNFVTFTAPDIFGADLVGKKIIVPKSWYSTTTKNVTIKGVSGSFTPSHLSEMEREAFIINEWFMNDVDGVEPIGSMFADIFPDVFIPQNTKTNKTKLSKSYSKAFIDYATDVHNSLMFRYPTKSSLVKYSDGFKIDVADVKPPSIDVIRDVATKFRNGFGQPLLLESLANNGKFNAKSYRQLIQNLTYSGEYSVPGEYMSDAELQVIARVMAGGENAATIDVIKTYQTLQAARRDAVISPLKDHLSSRNKVFEKMNIQELNLELTDLGWSRERKAALFSDYWILTRAKNDTNPIRDYMLATGFFPNESDLVKIGQQYNVPVDELQAQYRDLSDAILKNGYDTIINRQQVSQATIRSRDKYLAESTSWGIIKSIDNAELNVEQQPVQRTLLTQEEMFGGDVTSLINQLRVSFRGKFGNRGAERDLITTILGDPAKLNAKSIVDLFGTIQPVGSRRLPGTQPRSQRTNPVESIERQILTHVMSSASKTLNQVMSEMSDISDKVSQGLYVLGIGKNVPNITLETLINNPNIYAVNEKMTTEQRKHAQKIESAVKEYLTAQATSILGARAELYRSLVDESMLGIEYVQDTINKNVYSGTHKNGNTFKVNVATGRVIYDGKGVNEIPGVKVNVSSREVMDFVGSASNELLPIINEMTNAEFKLAKLVYELMPNESKVANEYDSKKYVLSTIFTAGIERPVPAEYWHAVASIKDAILNPNTRRPQINLNGETAFTPLLDSVRGNELTVEEFAGTISENDRVAFVEPVLNKWMMPNERNIRRVSVDNDGAIGHDGVGYTVFQDDGARSRTFQRLVDAGFTTDKALEIYALTEHPNFQRWANGPLLENIEMSKPGDLIANASNMSVKQRVNFNKAKAAIDLKHVAQRYQESKSPEDYEKLVFAFDQVFGGTLTDKQLQAAVKKATSNGKDVSALIATAEQYMLQNTDSRLDMHVRQYEEINNSANRLETGKAFTSLAFDHASDNATADNYLGFRSHDLVSGLHANTNLNTRPRFIKIDKPYVVDMHNQNIDADSFRIAIKEGSNKKYDGVVFKNVSDDMYSTTNKVLAYTFNDAQVLPLNNIVRGEALPEQAAAFEDVMRDIPEGVIPAPMFGTAPALRATPIIPVEKTLGQKASEKLLRAEREWQGWTRWSLAFDMAWGAIQGGKYAIGFAAFKPMDTVLWAQSWYGALKGMAPNFRYMIGGKKVGADNIGRREYAKIYLDMRQDKHWETIKALGAPLHMYNYEAAIQKARNSEYQKQGGKVKYEDILIDLMDISETGHAEEYMVKDASINKIPMAGMYERQISLQHDLLMYKLIKYQLETNSLLQGLTHEQILQRPDAQKIVNFIAISLGDFQYSTDEHIDMKWGRLAKWVSVAPRWQLANWLMKPHYNWLAQNIPAVTIKGKEYSVKKLLGEDNRVWNSMVRYEDNKELAKYQFKTIYGTMIATAAIQQIVNLLGKYVFKRDDIRALPKVGSWRFLDFEFHDSSGVWDDVNKTLAIYNALVKKEKPDDKRLGAVDPTYAWFIDTSNKLGYNTSPAVLKLLNIWTGRDVLNRNIYESDENWNRYYQQNIKPFIPNAPESLDVSILVATTFPTAVNELFAASNEAFYEKPAIRRAVELTQFLFSHQGSRARYNKYVPEEYVKHERLQSQYKRNWSPKTSLVDIITKPGKTIPEKGQKMMTGVYNTSSKYPIQKLVNEYKKAKLP